MQERQITKVEKPMLLPLVTQPAKFYQTLQISNLKQAIESLTPPIGLIPKLIENGDVFVKGLIVLIIEDIVLFLNVGKTMNAAQINQTADLLLKDFNYFRVEDFKLCFDNAKRGFYGKQYDRLDGQVIYEWLSQYASDRANEAERLSNLKKFESSEHPNPEGQKKVTEILSSAIIGMKEKLSPKIRVDDEKTKLIKEFFNEFEEIYSNKPINTGTKKRFINYNGKNVDQVEFVELKLKEKYENTTL